MDREYAERLYDSGKDQTVAKLLEQDALIDELNERLDKLKKNSSNSSKPPSSDIVKPNRAARRREEKRRKKGGQHNHPRHERTLFAPEEINRWFNYKLSSCPECGGAITQCEDVAPRIIQQVSFPDVPVYYINKLNNLNWNRNQHSQAMG